MSQDLDQIYQEMILEHNRSPRNFGVLPEANYVAHGVNPLCGDDYFLFVRVDEAGVIRDIRFKGEGCAISKSSASMMTEAARGKTLDEFNKIHSAFLDQLICVPRVMDGSALGKLSIFEGVKKFPIRVKCATLIWRTYEEALSSRGASSSVYGHLEHPERD